MIVRQKFEDEPIDYIQFSVARPFEHFDNLIDIHFPVHFNLSIEFFDFSLTFLPKFGIIEIWN